MHPDRTVLVIDPGSESGWYVQCDCQFNILSEGPLPDHADMRSWIEGLDVGLAFVEDVGKVLPGDGLKAATTFCQHRGALEQELLAVPTVWWIAPQSWQKVFYNAFGDADVGTEDLFSPTFRNRQKSSRKDDVLKIVKKQLKDGSLGLRSADAYALYLSLERILTSAKTNQIPFEVRL